MLDLEKITLNVREIALRAGAFLRNERSGFDRSKVEKKNAHDYVSYVDKESERRIVAQLRELLPEAGFIAAYSSLVTCLTRVFFPARANTASANTAQLVSPSQVAWNSP